MTKYFENILATENVMKNIKNIIGKGKYIHIGYTNGKIRVIEIDDKKLSASKKKELQKYVDTLEK